MRRRDIAPKEPPKPSALQEDVVRLEKLVSDQPPPDLTPVEAQLRTMRGEIAELRDILARMPQDGRQQATNYRFVVHRRDDQLIDYVDGIAMSKNPTLLERAAAKLH